MKKFLPYIFITTFIGAFLMISFSPSFSGTFSGTSNIEVEASVGVKEILGSLIYSAVGIFTIADLVGWGDWGSMADATFGNVVKWTSSLTWYLSAKLFTLSGYLLDYAVDFSVKDFKKNIENIGIVKQGYEILLNFANMIFIFLLLYIAIKTILGEGGDTKKFLTRIIIVALMINFSLFMTKVLIDASNIVAMGFYNAIRTEAGKAKIEGSEKEQQLISVGSVSTAMMAGLRLQTLLPAYDSEYNKKDTSKGFSNLNMAVNQFGGSALFLVTAFVFFSGSFLFFVRFITLLFYMMLSPVAFLGYISPELKSYSSDWWKGLQNQAIFAPVFLFFAYLISSLVNSGLLWEAVGGNTGSSQTFYDTISSSGRLGMSIILNYVILIALMLGGLMTAKKMAAVGSHGATKYAEKFQGWAQGMMGRNTIGRAAYLAGNNRYMAKIIEKSPTLGTFAKTQFDNMAGAKFGGAKGGYAKALKDSVDKKKKMGEFVGKAKVAKTDELIRTEEDRLYKMKSLKELKENADKATRILTERDRLSDIANISYDPADFAALSNFERVNNFNREVLQREQALLENRLEAESRVKDLASYKKKAQEKMKRGYAKNIEFNSPILNKLFRSGADAAIEIRKPKAPLDKSLMDIIKEYNEQQASAGGGATGGAGGAGGAGTGGATGGRTTP